MIMSGSGRRARKRGDFLLRVLRKAKEEEFALEREKRFQEQLVATVMKVETLRQGVEEWYKENEKPHLLPRSISAKYPVHQ